MTGGGIGEPAGPPRGAAEREGGEESEAWVASVRVGSATVAPRTFPPEASRPGSGGWWLSICGSSTTRRAASSRSGPDPGSRRMVRSMEGSQREAGTRRRKGSRPWPRCWTRCCLMAKRDEPMSTVAGGSASTGRITRSAGRQIGGAGSIALGRSMQARHDFHWVRQSPPIFVRGGSVCGAYTCRPFPGSRSRCRRN
jgi:hypothetical protein